MENNEIKIGGRHETSTSYFVEVVEIKDTIVVCNRLSLGGRRNLKERKLNGVLGNLKCIVSKDKLMREL